MSPENYAGETKCLVRTHQGIIGIVSCQHQKVKFGYNQIFQEVEEESIFR